MKPVNYLPRFIAIVFLIAGVPVFIEIYKATNDLTISVILSIVYELLVLVGSFVSKVWQRLETKLTEQVAEKIESKIQVEISDYKDRYLEYLTYQHRFFDIKGLQTQGPYNLELNKVFVQLCLDPAPVHQIEGNPIQPNNNKEKNLSTFSIWEYISRNDVENHNLAILGAPGCGKTTLLKHIALTLSASKYYRSQYKAPSLLPILLFLRDHANDINNNPNIKLAKLIHDQFERRQAPLPPEGWLEKHLGNGECLIMLDGLDEVANIETRKNIVAWVENCMSAYGKNRFIISSRPHGYKTMPLNNVTVLQVQPFTKSQIREFISSWYLTNEIMSSQKDDPGVHADAIAGGDDLLDRIFSTPTLETLAVNPLLLVMIATIHRYRSSLPGRRVELYAEICEVFLGKRQEARGISSELTPKQKQSILQPLAYYLMKKNLREINKTQINPIIRDGLLRVNPALQASDFLSDIENTSGLIVEYESNQYGFSHLTFQEYLAAVYIIENGLENELCKEVANPWWLETIRLYCAQTNASNIVNACLRVPNILSLTLATECIEEAREVSLETRQLYDKVMSQGLEHPNPEIRKLVAEVMLKARIRKY